MIFFGPRNDSSMRRVAGLAFVALSSLVLIYVFWSARLLRPLADDYFYGAFFLKEGLLGGTIHTWNTWAGSLTAQLANFAFIGLPIGFLPWWLSSFLPFVLTVGVVTFFACWLLAQPVVRSKHFSPTITWMQIAPITAFSYLGYWWLPTLFFADDPDTFRFPFSTTFWQNINIQYILVPICITWLWLVIDLRFRAWWRVLGLGVLGLLVGFGTFVFATSTILACLLFSLSLVFTRRGPVRARLVAWALGAVSTCLALVINLGAPGSRNRAQFLPSPEVDGNFVADVLTAALPQGVASWWSEVYNPLYLGLLAFLAAIFWLLGMQFGSGSSRHFMLLGASFGSFSLTLFIINRVSELFAYQAFWHEVTPRIFLWLSIPLFSAGIGAYLAKYSGGLLATSVVLFIAGVCFALIASSLFVMTVETYSRWTQWEVGPAPVRSVADIDNTYFAEMYRSIQRARGGPHRGLAGSDSPTWVEPTGTWGDGSFPGGETQALM